MTPLTTTTNATTMTFKFFMRAAPAALAVLLAAGTAHAHGSRAGDVEITHAFATPTQTRSAASQSIVSTCRTASS